MPDAVDRKVWVALSIAVGVEFVLGIACVVLVPLGRPDEWVPLQGRAVYIAHAAIGALLGIGAVAVLLCVTQEQRAAFIGARVGLAGVGLAAGGGTLAVYHPWRLSGMALMFGGSFVAVLGFLVALKNPMPEEAQEE